MVKKSVVYKIVNDRVIVYLYILCKKNGEGGEGLLWNNGAELGGQHKHPRIQLEGSLKRALTGPIHTYKVIHEMLTNNHVLLELVLQYNIRKFWTFSSCLQHRLLIFLKVYSSWECKGLEPRASQKSYILLNCFSCFPTGLLVLFR